jgi:hypothetical protein
MSYEPSVRPPKASNPSPEVSAEVVSFQSIGLREYEGRYALIIDGLFSAKECTWLLQQALESTRTDGTSHNSKLSKFKTDTSILNVLVDNPWHVAQLNGGSIGNQYTNTDVRNSSRIIVDSHSIADWILAKLRPHLQDIEAIEGAAMHRMVNGKEWRERVQALNAESDAGKRQGRNGKKSTQKEPNAVLTRLNERLRFLKYTPGQFFKPHYDGCYFTEDKSEASYMTLQIYLNGPEPSPEDGLEFADPEPTPDAADVLKGGATRFFSSKSFRSKRGSSHGEDAFFDVAPKLGRVLVFEQEGMVHSGETITSGVKYTLRTDFMYALEDSA